MKDRLFELEQFKYEVEQTFMRGHKAGDLPPELEPDPNINPINLEGIKANESTNG
jgi:hypothetical protein